MVSPRGIYRPEVILAQLSAPPPAAIRRLNRVILHLLMQQAEHEAWILGHRLAVERIDKYEAVGWCETCDWAASIDTRPSYGDSVFMGSALFHPCPGERTPPPWAN